MDLRIAQATPEQTAIIASILFEAAEWLRISGRPMLGLGHTAAEAVRPSVEAREVFIAYADGEPAGVMKFVLDDPEFWPEAPGGSSAFMHRLAVRRRFAGMCVSVALVQFSAQRAAGMGRSFLRLDCAEDRPRLRAVYERMGFTLHSIFDAGEFCAARYEMALNCVADRRE